MRGSDYIEAELTDRLKACREQLAKAQAALAAVQEIHVRVEDSPGIVYCEECCRTEYGGLELVYAEWPCPTIQAVCEEQS